MNWNEWLADAVSVVHACFSMFVVFGVVLILTGRVLRWRWTDNKTFRVTHLIAISAVFLRVIVGMPCPCSRWEDSLRTGPDGKPITLNTTQQIIRKLAFRGARENRFQGSLFTLVGVTVLSYWEWNRRRRSEFQSITTQSASVK